MLRIHACNKPLADDVLLETLADRIDGMTGADIESLANEATLLAVRRARMTDGESVRVTMDDFLCAMAPGESKPHVFDKLDSVLVESSSQLAEPTGRAIARVTMQDDTIVEGELIWADASLIKLKNSRDGTVTVVSRYQLRTIEPLKGTETESRENVVADPWARHMPDLA